MTPGGGCDAVRPVLPELALGIADGRERAEALEHAFSCPECQRALAELSELSDELLLLAPAEEPPVGFESRLIERLELPAPLHSRRRRRFRIGPRLALAAAALAGAAATATGLVLAYRDDHRLAGQYRAALERVGGQYFQGARLVAGDGAAAGKVFGYQGEPSWLFVIVYTPYRHGALTGELVTTSGRRIPLVGLRLDERHPSWGGAIPVDLREVARVELRSAAGTLAAALPPGPRA